MGDYMSRSDYEQLRDKAKNSQQERINFTTYLKQSLVEGALIHLFEKVVDFPTTEQSNLLKSIVIDYVKENNANSILDKMVRVNSVFMVETARIIEEFYNKILKEADGDPENGVPVSYAVSLKDEEEFYKELDKNTDVNDVAQAIALRVTTAEEEFINKNVADKLDMEEIVNSAAERIDAVRNSRTQETEEKAHMEAFYNQIATNSVENLRKRDKNLYEQLLYNFSDSALRSGTLAESYVDHDTGKIDMERIGQTVKVFYTFAEMMNSIQLESFTVESINDFINLR